MKYWFENSYRRVLIDMQINDCDERFMAKFDPAVYVRCLKKAQVQSPIVRSRMFDPFYTNKLRGQGMGLSVVLGVARAHSGGVVVESVPDHGSVFRVIFPCPSALNAS